MVQRVGAAVGFRTPVYSLLLPVAVTAVHPRVEYLAAAVTVATRV